MNKATMIIINDGDGSQCGASYKRRCDLARIWYGTEEAWLKIAQRICAHDADPIIIMSLALEAAAYYREHIKEVNDYANR